jgi:HAD superfamily hydrolase (TIGR01509 family)
MLKGIIFDFDGVIIDTEKKKFEDIKKILSKYGFKINKEDFPGFIGKKTAFYINEKFPEISREKINKILKERKHLQFKNLKKNRLILGIRVFLKFLKSKKYKLAIATGSKRVFVRKILIIYDLLKYFDIIVTGEDFKSSKPNPECYTKALRKMKLKPGEIIIIEDSPAGILAGKKIRARVFAVQTYMDKEELAAADEIFNNSLQILKRMKKEI